MCSPWQSLDARVLGGESATPRGANSRYHAGSMSKPLSRGVHHLALNTDDMKMTLDSTCAFLGMPLVHALRVPPGLGPARATAATRRSRISATTFSTRAAIRCSPSSRSRRAPSPGRPRCDRYDAARVFRSQRAEVQRRAESNQEVEYRISRPGQRRLRNLFDLRPRPERHSPGVLAPEGERARVVERCARPRARRSPSCAP